MNSSLDFVYVTPEYQSNEFCSLPVSILFTNHFTRSNEFTKSDLFSTSHKFTKSDLFSISHEFTKSNIFTESEAFTKSDIFTESNFFEKESKIESNELIQISLTLSLTFVQKRSVTYTVSNLMSNSYYITFDDIMGTFTIYATKSDYMIFIPYIIYYYSPIYVSTNLIIEIKKRKGPTGEQLIGISCGSSAVFFIFLFIIITIYRKMANIKNFEFNYSYSTSSSSGAFIKAKDLINEVQNNQVDDSNNDESDLDFWL